MDCYAHDTMTKAYSECVVIYCRLATAKCSISLLGCDLYIIVHCTMKGDKIQSLCIVFFFSNYIEGEIQGLIF